MSIKHKLEKTKDRIVYVPTFERSDVKDEVDSFGKTAKSQVAGKPSGLFGSKPSNTPPQTNPIVEAMLQSSDDPLTTTKGAQRLDQEILDASHKREREIQNWSEDQMSAMSPPQGEKKKFSGLPVSGSKQPGIPGIGNQPKNPEMMKKKG